MSVEDALEDIVEDMLDTAPPRISAIGTIGLVHAATVAAGYLVATKQHSEAALLQAWIANAALTASSGAILEKKGKHPHMRGAATFGTIGTVLAPLEYAIG